MKKKGKIDVYGSSVVCASCVGAPSSKETEEWLRAAISRQYSEDFISVEYIDVSNLEQMTEQERQIAEKIIAEDRIYPVIVINEKIIAEGTPRLADIYKAIEEQGYVEAN